MGEGLWCVGGLGGAIYEKFGVWKAVEVRGGATSVDVDLGKNFVDVINDSLPLSWSALILAILVEIFATTHLKLSRDKSSLAGVSLSMLLFNVSLTLFATSLGQIPVSTAYAIWSALGTTAVSFAGITIFGEPCNSLKLVSLLSIMVGVVGLNLADRDDL